MYSVIVPLRIEHEDRYDNLFIYLNYYSNCNMNAEFIVVEDSAKPSDEVKKLCKHYNFKYLHRKNKDIFNKCKSYNYGFKHSDKRSTHVVAMDVDVIVDSVLIEYFVKHVDTDIMRPYNGAAFYVNEKVKNFLLEQTNLEYKHFSKFLPNKYKSQYKDENLRVPNLNAVGGCVIFKREAFIRCGGYNPNFIGWGYEDNEVIYRFQRLKCVYSTIKITKEPKAVLWHIHHRDAIRNSNPKYNHNKMVITNSKKLNDTEYKKYIESWKDELI